MLKRVVALNKAASYLRHATLRQLHDLVGDLEREVAAAGAAAPAAAAAAAEAGAAAGAAAPTEMPCGSNDGLESKPVETSFEEERWAYMRYDGSIKVDGDVLVTDGTKVALSCTRDPAEGPSRSSARSTSARVLASV